MNRKLFRIGNFLLILAVAGCSSISPAERAVQNANQKAEREKSPERAVFIDYGGGASAVNFEWAGMPAESILSQADLY